MLIVCIIYVFRLAMRRILTPLYSAHYRANLDLTAFVIILLLLLTTVVLFTDTIMVRLLTN